MAVETFAQHRMTLRAYLLAWEAGVYDSRVELLDGEVRDVQIGIWHAETTGTVIRALPTLGCRLLAGSLPAGESLPEPDCWILRRGAEPIEQLSPRMTRWAATDVLLVVEVSDETHEYDLGPKAALYARSGFEHYWSVTRKGVYAHSEPGPSGYRQRRFHAVGETVAVPYAEGVELAVEELISPEG